MKFFQKEFDAIDSYFKPKKKSEKWLMIIAVMSMIFYFSYAFFVPYAKKNYRKSEITKSKVEQSITDKSVYLDSISIHGNKELYIINLDKKVMEKEKNITKLKKKIVFLDTNLMKISDKLFNKKSWSNFLDTITKKAQHQNVNIEYITNQQVDNNGSFGYVLEVGIGCKGKYKGIVKFMNELEQNMLVTDIYKTVLSYDHNSSDIIADINISVWGINY